MHARGTRGHTHHLTRAKTKTSPRQKYTTTRYQPHPSHVPACTPWPDKQFNDNKVYFSTGPTPDGGLPLGQILKKYMPAKTHGVFIESGGNDGAWLESLFVWLASGLDFCHLLFLSVFFFLASPTHH
jgi:hypothetical protein